MRRWGLCLCLLVVVLTGGLAGCASSDSDDISARPWNAPRHWETGLPSGMYEGR
jgi:type IV pilus biogenesis protein CpaD/CtpE